MNEVLQQSHEVSTRHYIRKKIVALERAMLTVPQEEHVDISLRHYFAPGLYAREALLPAGTLIVGKIHQHAHVNTISQGRIKVITEGGAEIFEAPYTFVSEVGTKRCVMAETDTIWTTYHPTDETDLKKIEEKVISQNFVDLEGEL